MTLYNEEKNMRIVASHVPGRKNPALIFQYDKAAVVCGYFINEKMAIEFMKNLAEFVGAK